MARTLNPTNCQPEPDARTADGVSARAYSLGIAAVCLLAVAGSFNTLWNDFVYDDIPIIVRNPLVTEPNRFAEIWTTDYWVGDDDPKRDLLYRPVAVSSYRLDHMLWGLRPFGFHLTNVLLHAVVSGLVVLLARSSGCPPIAALVGGTLFAVMPVHTEAVANVVGRAEILSALFLVAALLAGMQVRWAGTAPAVGLWAVFTAICMAGAMFSKENGAAVVVLVPLFALLVNPRSQSRSTEGGMLGKRGAALLICTLSAVVLAVGLLLRYHALGGNLVQSDGGSRMTNMLVEATPAGRFWGAFQLFGLHLAKTFVPRTLCMDYSYKAIDPAISPMDIHVIIGLIGLAAVLGGMALAWRSGYRGLALCGLALLIVYLPVSNSVVLIRIWFAERVWYLPSVFVSVLVGFAAVRLAGFVGRKQLACALLAMVVLAGLVRGWVRNAEWRDHGILFASAYEIYPNSAQVLCCYGDWLVHSGYVEEGISLLSRAVGVAPEYTNARFQLAKAYLLLDQYEAAAVKLQTVLMDRPEHRKARELRDQVAARLAEQYQSRIEMLERKYQDAPDNLEALVELSELLNLLGRTEQARQLFKDAEPGFAASAAFHRALGVQLMTSGQRDDAIEAYRHALSLEPDQPESAVELAMALLDRRGSGDMQEAQALLERTAAAHPEHPQVIMAQAEWLFLRDRRQEAIQLYTGLLGRTPPGEFRDMLKTRVEFLRGGE